MRFIFLFVLFINTSLIGAEQYSADLPKSAQLIIENTKKEVEAVYAKAAKAMEAEQIKATKAGQLEAALAIREWKDSYIIFAAPTGLDSARPAKKDPLEALVVGTWTMPSWGGVYQFNADKTFTVSNGDRGTWSVKDGVFVAVLASGITDTYTKVTPGIASGSNSRGQPISIKKLMSLEAIQPAYR
jgi:hypothetical protein